MKMYMLNILVWWIALYRVMSLVVLDVVPLITESSWTKLLKKWIIVFIVSAFPTFELLDPWGI